MRVSRLKAAAIFIFAARPTLEPFPLLYEIADAANASAKVSDLIFFNVLVCP
ncbi:hypothetical protein D3C83_269370 [compost metagenome]